MGEVSTSVAQVAPNQELTPGLLSLGNDQACVESQICEKNNPTVSLRTFNLRWDEKVILSHRDGDPRSKIGITLVLQTKDPEEWSPKIANDRQSEVAIFTGTLESIRDRGARKNRLKLGKVTKEEVELIGACLVYPNQAHAERKRLANMGIEVFHDGDPVFVPVFGKE